MHDCDFSDGTFKLADSEANEADAALGLDDSVGVGRGAGSWCDFA